jgi:membrane protein required for colicin V production
MNWVDFVLIALLLTAIIIGSKKGLVRELSAFAVVFAVIIFTVNYIDSFAVWVNDKLGGSPLISAFVSFILLLAFSYGLFKLLAYLFYKVASIKSSGTRDQVGGAIVGLARGWLSIGLLTLVVFLLPMPESFYSAFDSSFLGKAVAKTVPLMYDGTRMMHPANPDFMQKMESTLLTSSDKGRSHSQGRALDSNREEVYRVMYQIDRFFGNTGGS